jgi:hypothetical protein
MRSPNLEGEMEGFNTPISPSRVLNMRSPNHIGLGLKFITGGDGGGLNYSLIHI